MLQIILTLAIFVILVIPMGKYMYHIATKQKTFADKVFNPIDRCIYKVCGIKGEDMGWKKYALTLLLVNAVMVFVGYAILRLQSILFLNPNGISNMEPTLSFNTIISFMTNTNLQHYSGESGLSYVGQFMSRQISAYFSPVKYRMNYLDINILISPPVRRRSKKNP